jgi:hypothetical protein
MIGRADIEEQKSNIAMNTWLQFQKAEHIDRPAMISRFVFVLEIKI